MQVNFYQLSRAVQDRFIASLRGEGSPSRCSSPRPRSPGFSFAWGGEGRSRYSPFGCCCVWGWEYSEILALHRGRCSRSMPHFSRRSSWRRFGLQLGSRAEVAPISSGHLRFPLWRD